MTKFFRIIRFILIQILFLSLFSCASNKIENESLEQWLYSPDKMLSVKAQQNGILIQKSSSSKYKNIVIHVEKLIPSKKKNLPNSYDFSTVDIAANSIDNSYLYPFTKKNEIYCIYMTYQNKSNGKKYTSDEVFCKAIGGLGECTIKGSAVSKSYDSKNWLLKFSSFLQEIPVKIDNYTITGYVHSSNNSKPYYYNDFEIKNSSINLKPLMGQIRNSTFYLDLDYNFSYKGINFTQNFFNNKNTVFKDTNSVFKVSNTGLPSIYITTANNRAIDSREKYVNAEFQIENKKYSMKIKGRGNSSWGRMPKHSYTLKFDKKQTVLGMPENKSWVLVSNFSDKTLIRNQYTYYIGKEIFNRMMWNPSFKQVDLYINQIYQGTYLFGEKITISEKRVNIQDISKIKVDVNKDKYLNIEDGGFIVEMNRREDEAFNFRTTHDVSISLKDPDSVDKKTRQHVQKIIQNAENAMFSKNFKDPNYGYAAYIDVDSFVDWYIINEFNKNVDSAWFSSIYIVYDPKDGKIHLGPMWDYDLSFGNINYNDCDKTYGFYIRTRSVWYSQLFKDPAFKEKVKNRWNEKKSVLYKSIDEQIDILYKNVLESSYYNFEVWPILGTFVWPNANGYENRLSTKSEINYLKKWCKDRFDWMDKQIQTW